MCAFGLTFAIRRSSRVSGDPLDDAATDVHENADNSSVRATSQMDADCRLCLWRRGRCDVVVGVDIVAGIVCECPDARIAITFGLTV
jgi:hypothetical protein